ncbi:hypothetical protein ACSQ67_004270 [Phaseolus vulgaris]
MTKKPKADGAEDSLPDHLRCGRTDGRQWRCRRRVKDNLKLCEIHYLQGRHRQYKEKVPESLKLQRKRKTSEEEPNAVDNVESRARRTSRIVKKKRRLFEGSEALVVAAPSPAKKKALKQGDMQGAEEGIAKWCDGNFSASPTRDYDNVASHFDVKVGVDSKTVTPRYFRSKNVDRVPVGKLQIVPYGSNLKNGTKGKRKKCHWCQRSESCNLIQCLSCEREFFCMDCIKERFVIVELT